MALRRLFYLNALVSTQLFTAPASRCPLVCRRQQLYVCSSDVHDPWNGNRPNGSIVIIAVTVFCIIQMYTSCWAFTPCRLEDYKAEKGASSLQAFDRQLADAALMTTETGVLKDNMRSGARRPCAESHLFDCFNISCWARYVRWGVVRRRAGMA